jgi:carotenoid cleavage dioxygenase
MTAHTRLDPENGDLHFFGYEASGIASRDVGYCVADKEGNLVREEWFEVPYCALMHDFVVTKEHVIFPVFPITADLDRIKAGGCHWVWEPTKETFVGIMPREGWTCDLARPSERWEEYKLGPSGEMPRIAGKDFMVDYDIGYYQTYDPEAGPPLVCGPVGAGFNTMMRMEVKSGRLTKLAVPPGMTIQEAVHIPSKKPGHEGYLAFVVDLHEKNLSEVWLVEAANLAKGPIARIHVPLRLRAAVHGNWVATAELEGRKRAA